MGVILVYNPYIIWLVVGTCFMAFHIFGIVTPTDKLIFFRGVGIPPTRNGEEEQPIIKRISSPITLFGRCAEDKANKECLLVKKTNSELLGLWCIYTIYTVYSCLLLM